MISSSNPYKRDGGRKNPYLRDGGEDHIISDITPCPGCGERPHESVGPDYAVDTDGPLWLTLDGDEVPAWLARVPDEWYVPTWRTMDGGPPSVYAIDIERSLKARRPLVEEAY